MTTEEKQELIEAINVLTLERGLSVLMLGSDPTEYAEAIVGLQLTRLPGVPYRPGVMYSREKVIKCKVEMMRDPDDPDQNEDALWDMAQEDYEFNTVRSVPYLMPGDDESAEKVDWPWIIVDDD